MNTLLSPKGFLSVAATVAAVFITSACGGGGSSVAQATTPPIIVVPPITPPVVPPIPPVTTPPGDGTPLLNPAQTGQDLALLTPKKQTKTASPVGASEVTAVMDWAEASFPQYFPGPQSERQLAPYIYRYYAATDTYLSVANKKVYVLGPATNKALKLVGSLSDFLCTVRGENCYGVDPAFNAGPGCDADAITCVKVASTSTATQSSVPITFGQPFKVGDLPNGMQLRAQDTAGADITMQMDDVSSYSDGSVRFAVLSAQVNNLQPGEIRVVNLFKAARNAPTPANLNTGTFDPTLAATIYSPQVSEITFGNRSGTTPGIAFVAGEQIVLKLSGALSEQYSLVVSSAQAGGGFQTLTKIAEDFLSLVNKSSKVYKAYKIGAGGGYEKLWITPIAPESAAFEVSLSYSGQARNTIQTLQAYEAPQRYESKPKLLLSQMVAAGNTPRLTGSVAKEYTVVAPFISVKTGAKHPQLTARLHTRFVDSGQRVRMDMVIENNWTYDPKPGNLTYELAVTQSGQTIFKQEPFTHNHHSRWHKVLWLGASEPQAQLRHNMRYFLDSKAVQNYDLTLAVPESVLAAEGSSLAKVDTRPMGAAQITPYFPTTGGRSDIGPLPRWTALFLVTQDPRSLGMMLANANAAAGIQIHFRDSITDQAVSLEAHPGLAMLLGSSTAKDALPPVVNGETIWSPDAAHQASFAYVPYLVTGDVFYLDEAIFWANWNMGRVNPGYRGGAQGLVVSNEMRAQAWSLRSIGEVTRAIADTHPMKEYFKTKLADNLAWYVNGYPRDTTGAVSPLGMMEKGDAVGQTAPWQNDFMALVVGQLAEAGDPQAAEYFKWISRFTVGRFINESAGFCRAQAPGYYIAIRDSANNFVSTWGALFKLNWPTITSCDPNRAVDGDPTSAAGYAAYARGMLGNAASLGITRGNGRIFILAPDYATACLMQWLLIQLGQLYHGVINQSFATGLKEFFVVECEGIFRQPQNTHSDTRTT